MKTHRGRELCPLFLIIEAVHKSFGGVHALKGVGFDIRPGEVHGLVGANGAGKSTIIRILAGLERPDSGTVMIDDAPIQIDNAQAATALGLSFIHQELALVPGMTILENIMLGSKKKSRFGLVDWQAIAKDVEPVLERVGLTMAVIVGELDLSVGFNASFAGVLVIGLIVHSELPIIVAMVVVVGVGALIGFINGIIVTKARVNSVIATLGVGTIVVGLSFAYSSGVPIVSGVPEAFKEISLGRFHGVPHNIIIMVVLIILWVLVERTAIGQAIQAVGGNPAAARLSGISVDGINILGLTLSEACAALAGILLASRFGSMCAPVRGIRWASNS